MKLRFCDTKIQNLAKRYEEKNQKVFKEAKKFQKSKSKVQKDGYIDKDLLERITRWKAGRNIHADKNCDAYVREITAYALKANNERTKIEVLTCLDGVLFPTASAILHFFHKGRYPILDVRALWSIGFGEDEIAKTKYTFSFWWDYVSFCRETAARNDASMRTLDMSLWQYSKENQ